jgi:hypothetical protein
MRTLCPDVYVQEAGQRFYGVEMGARMTVLNLSGGGLVHSPVAVPVDPLQSFDFTREVVLLHRPSGTLIVSDLVFHIQSDAPFWTRAAMTALWGYPGCCVTVLERVGMRRDVARKELKMLLSQDFDRLIMAHGAVIETGGKAALERAFSWLW